MKAVPISRYLVFFAIAIGGSVADLATKHWIFDRLGPPSGRIWWLWEGVFGFQTSLNEGALFGMGQGKVFVFATLSIIAALGILSWLFLAGAARSWPLTLALGAICAGIFGNLYDRLGLPGLAWPPGIQGHQAGEPVYAVRDWILVMLGDYPWPSFNIADSLLVCGAILLIGHALFAGNPQQQSATSSP